MCQIIMLYSGRWKCFTVRKSFFEQIVAKVSAVIRNGKRINYRSYHWQLYALFWPKSHRMRILFLKIFRKLSKIKRIFSGTIA